MSLPARVAAPLSLALFSVCADRLLVGAAFDALAKIPGALFVGEFHDYITADRTPQFDSAIDRATICAALVDFDRDATQALNTSEQLRRIFRDRVRIVGLASQHSAELLLQAMRAGCNEFLTKPIPAETLTACFARFQSSLEGAVITPNQGGRVIAFYGAKGGVGTSVIAVHVATHLARTRRTLLIDHHRSLGHVALYLGLENGQYSVADVMRNADRLDADLLGGFLARHGSGLDVIPSPENHAPAPPSTPEGIQRVLTLLRREYEYILVDAAVDDSPSLPQHADDVYIVSTPDIASLRDLSRRRHRIVNDGADSAVSLILNRTTREDAITPDQIREQCGLAIACVLPDAYPEVLRAINRGDPAQPGKQLPFAKRTALLAQQIANAGSASNTQPEAAKKRFALWRR